MSNAALLVIDFINDIVNEKGKIPSCAAFLFFSEGILFLGGKNVAGVSAIIVIQHTPYLYPQKVSAATGV